MENQQTESIAEQAKKRNGGSRLPMPALVLGTVATAFAIIWLTMYDGTSSRPSTPSEIAAQKEFHDKLITAQEEFYQKIEVATKEAEQKSNSSGN